MSIHDLFDAPSVKVLIDQNIRWFMNGDKEEGEIREWVQEAYKSILVKTSDLLPVILLEQLLRRTEKEDAVIRSYMDIVADEVSKLDADPMADAKTYEKQIHNDGLSYVEYFIEKRKALAALEAAKNSEAVLEGVDEADGEKTAAKTDEEKAVAETVTEMAEVEADGETMVSEAAGEKAEAEADGETMASEADGEKQEAEADSETNASEADDEKAVAEADTDANASEADDEKAAAKAGDEKAEAEADGDKAASEADGEKAASEAEDEKATTEADGSLEEEDTETKKKSFVKGIAAGLAIGIGLAALIFIGINALNKNPGTNKPEETSEAYTTEAPVTEEETETTEEVKADIPYTAIITCDSGTVKIRTGPGKNYRSVALANGLAGLQVTCGESYPDENGVDRTWTAISLDYYLTRNSRDLTIIDEGLAELGTTYYISSEFLERIEE